LNERKLQQQDDKMKKSLALIESTTEPYEKETRNSNARVKNVAKGKEVINYDKDHTYDFVDEFLEESIKSSMIDETDEDVDNEYWSSNHNAHAMHA
jgi:hypothetical protein